MELKMFGVKAKYKIKKQKDIQWLEPVLIQWLKINRDYIEETDYEDCLYWYNERANVSTFAGAMWKCGGFALEEYSAHKSDENENSKKGRIDLYIQSHGNSAVCEAKIEWIYLCEPNRQQKDFAKTISNSIEKANNDLTNTLKMNSNNLGIALNFIVGYSNQDIDITETLASLQNAIEDTECAFFAWLLVEEKQILSSKNQNFNFVALIGTIQHK